MGLREDLESEVNSVIATKWEVRSGSVVPSAEDVALGAGAVQLDAAMLYADLADSTKLAMQLPAWLAAEISKAFLATSCRVIRFHGGHIRSFDGDRVMGVFIGADRSIRAVKAAMQITWTVINVLRPKFSHYSSLASSGLSIRHGTGIDVGNVFVARTGIRRNNDLVWVGRAPNIAAKLASIRDGVFTTYVTDAVFRELDESTYWHQPGDGASRKIMWDQWIWPDAPLGMKPEFYRSSYYWRPPGNG